MSRNFSRNLLVALGLAILGSTAGICASNSSSATVTLNATLPESVTMTVSSNSVTFPNLTPGGTSVLATPLTITTSWTAQGNRAKMYVVGYFSSPSAALTGQNFTTDSDVIPSSAVEGQVTVGAGSPGSWTPFTGSPAGGGPGVAGATLNIDTITLGSTNYYATNHTDTLGLEINLSALPQQPADTYQGTLNIEAEAL